MSVELRAEGIQKRFGGLLAVDQVDLVIEPGSITGLIGPNGAGKTTTFNLLTGVLQTDVGTVTIDGVDVTGAGPAAVAAHGVGRTFQTPRGFPSLTVLENVEVVLPDPRDRMLRALFGFGRAAGNRDRARDALDKVGLLDRAEEPFGNLSIGEQRLLEIARQLVREPKILLLDEPTAGVHPSLQGRLRELLLGLHEGGMTILTVEHNLGFLMSIATHLYVMTLGRVIASGDARSVANDPAVIEAYLGRGAHAAPSS
jgi:branched-chain amino acid transport system ATP-binding protein